MLSWEYIKTIQPTSGINKSGWLPQLLYPYTLHPLPSPPPPLPPSSVSHPAREPQTHTSFNGLERPDPKSPVLGQELLHGRCPVLALDALVGALVSTWTSLWWAFCAQHPEAKTSLITKGWAVQEISSGQSPDTWTDGHTNTRTQWIQHTPWTLLHNSTWAVNWTKLEKTTLWIQHEDSGWKTLWIPKQKLNRTYCVKLWTKLMT